MLQERFIGMKCFLAILFLFPCTAMAQEKMVAFVSADGKRKNVSASNKKPVTLSCNDSLYVQIPQGVPPKLVKNGNEIPLLKTASDYVIITTGGEYSLGSLRFNVISDRRMESDYDDLSGYDSGLDECGTLVFQMCGRIFKSRLCNQTSAE